MSPLCSLPQFHSHLFVSKTCIALLQDALVEVKSDHGLTEIARGCQTLGLHCAVPMRVTKYNKLLIEVNFIIIMVQ